MKKLILFFAMILLPAAVFAQSGSAGDLTWSLSDGTLTISGTGEMPDYGENSPPWTNYRESITTVIIEEGVTSIGSFAFQMYESLVSITIPNGVTNIGESAFSNDIKLASVNIPGSVIEIGSAAFMQCQDLASVTIENGVTKIGNNAFYHCRNLTSVTIPASVTWIGFSAFANCGMSSVSIPGSVTFLYSGAFANCSNLTAITVYGENTRYSSEGGVLFNSNKTELIQYPGGKTGHYDIPVSVAIIEVQAFAGCTGLTSVTIPSSVTSIGYGVFPGCTDLNDVYVSWTSPLSIDNDVFLDIDVTSVTLHVPTGTKTNYQSTAVWQDFKTIIDDVTLGGTTGDLTWSLSEGTLTISGTGAMPDYEENSPPWSNYRESITTVIIEEGVTSIGSYAFQMYESLASVTIPNSVTSIKHNAFYGCSDLKSITIPASVTWIGEVAFFNSGLTSVSIPGSVTVVANRAFAYCDDLTSITVDVESSNYSSENGILFNKDKTALVQYPGGKTGHYDIPDSVAIIEVQAFFGCTGLTSLTIPNSVTTIGQDAFSYCTGLTSVTLGNSVKTIGDYAFGACSSLKSVTIPNSVTTIGNGTFYNCSSLTSVTIPSSVTSIGERAFYYCSSLKSVTIPNSVTTIGERAFYRCSGLNDVYVSWPTPLSIPDYVFDDVDVASVTLHVPIGTETAYQSTAVWQDFNFSRVPALTVSPSTANIASSGGTATVAVTSNISWTASSSETWVTLSAYSGSNNGTVTITATANTGEERTATITFSGSDVTSQTVTVTQAAATQTPALTVSPATSNIAASGGTTSIAVTSNISWTASSSETWATVSPSSGSNNGTVTITAAENTGAARTATITFSGSGVTSQTVTVTQDEEQQVIVEPAPPAQEGEPESLILRLDIPTGDPFNGTFNVVLPPGMNLDLENTVLLGSLVDRYDLIVEPVVAGTWSVEIRLKSSLRTLSATEYQEIVKLAYTVDPSVTYGSYEIKIRDLEVRIGNETVIQEDEITVEVTAGDPPSGNESVEAATKVWYNGGILSVSTPASEHITVYSLSGAPVFRAEKAVGEAKYRLNSLPKGIYIVHGSSGWARKIIVRQ
jgi:hypothetical protein